MEEVSAAVPYLAVAYLLATGGAFCAFGLQGALWPSTVASKLLLDVPHPAGITGIRAMYGGFQLGIGGTLIFFALARATLATGLIVAAIVEVALVITRGYGMVADGGTLRLHMSYLVLEVAAFVAACILLFLMEA